MLLPAGRAALEVCRHAWDRRIGCALRPLELDVFVEQLETLLAGQLSSRRSEQASQNGRGAKGIRAGVGHRGPPSASASIW